MNPKFYIPFNWPKFQAQTHGWTAEQKWCYWVACCAYYWQECVGIENNEETMMLTCECFDKSRWALIRGRVFQGGGYFYLEGNFWHQDYAKEAWLNGKELMAKKANQTAAATKARHKQTLVVTDNATDNVTELSPTPSPTPSLTPSPARVSTHALEAEIPTWQEVKDYALGHAVPEKSAAAFYDYHKGNSLWLNGHGRMIDWRHKIVGWAVKDREKQSMADHSTIIPLQRPQGMQKGQNL